MNHISMPLCIVLIALMYFILREPCPCDEEDKVVEGLDRWWWVLIGWLGIGLLFLGWVVSMERGFLKEYINYSKFNIFKVFFTVFTGAFGYIYLDKFLLQDIKKVVVDSVSAEEASSVPLPVKSEVTSASSELDQTIPVSSTSGRTSSVTAGERPRVEITGTGKDGGGKRWRSYDT